MRVAVVGGTGFVGGYIVDALIEAGHLPSLLVRPGSQSKVSRTQQCRIITGSLADQGAIENTIDDCEAVIYNAGILRESPRQGVTFENAHFRGVVSVVDAAVKAGIERFILMSANGIHPPKTGYQETKCQAEQYVSESGLNYTVFRPSVIFGDPRGKMEIGTQLYQQMVRVPFPAIGFHTGFSPAKGAIMMTPVFVEDVAEAFVNCLGNPTSSLKVYALGGPREISWAGMLECIAEAVGKKKLILPMPVSLMKMVAVLLDWVPGFPVTREQLTMLAAGNTAPDDELRKLISRQPVAFTADSLAYLRH